MEKIYHYVDSSRFLVICAVFFLFGAIPAYASDIQYYYFEPELNSLYEGVIDLSDESLTSVSDEGSLR